MKMPFGKYKGFLISEIAKEDPPYLCWLAETATIDGGLEYEVLKYYKKARAEADVLEQERKHEQKEFNLHR